MAVASIGTLLAATAVAVVGASPATAADTVTCSPNISLFATDSTGKGYFWRGLSNFGAASNGEGTIAKGGPQPLATTDLGSYPTIFGSALPDNTIAAFGVSNSGSRQGITYWRNGVATRITSALYAFINASQRNLITSDRQGNIYDVNFGMLEQWRYDPATNTWPVWNRTLASGWDVYDKIVATEDGVIWATRTNGELWRWRVEPGSQRGLTGHRISTTFPNYRSVFSAGGDTLIGVPRTSGRLQAWRYIEDDGTGGERWAVRGVALDIPNTVDFTGYPNIWADPRTCKNSVWNTTPQPAVTPEEHAPVTVTERRALDGAEPGTDFAFVNGNGQIGVAHKPIDTAADTALTPQPISGARAYAGPPQIWQSTYGSATELRQSVLALERTGHVQRFIQGAAVGASYGDAAEHGGITTYPPTSVRLGPSWVAAFLTGADGRLFVSDSAWSRNSDGSTFVRPNLTSWRTVALPTGVTLAGSVTTTALDATHAAIVARDTNGALWSAVYTATPLGISPVGSWRSLGGSGFTGRPSAVMLPGPVIRVVARNGAGELVTQQQRSDGTFPGTWVGLGTPPAGAVGDPAVVTVGNPSAVVDPVDNRVVVFTRDARGFLYGAQQRYQACDTYDWWTVSDPGQGINLVADPTAYSVTGTNGKEWGVVSYDALFRLSVFFKSVRPSPDPPAPVCTSGSSGSSGLSARSSRSGPAPGGASAATTHPTFTVRTFKPMPKP